ncbi:MAG: hypothetical protein NDI94_05950 [Candidatus Woesearchaeota archaeon]|nr:hypothetical protein [Candidatus Woesearchaeota archaeon]
MITIHYLGNEFIKEDSLAIELAEKMKARYKDVVFKKIETFDDLMSVKDKYYFMDVCEGISSARLINDIAVFENIRSITSHDLDFGFFLKLNDKLGEVNKINIICLPKKTYDGIEKDIDNMIKILVKQNEKH